MGQPFIVQLRNQPGELGHLTRALAARGIQIEQISGSGAGALMCALISTSDDSQTREVLHSMGLAYVEGSTLIVEVEDKAGALARLSTKLGDAGVNIQGVCTIGHRAGMVEIALSVDDEAKAREALGLPVVYSVAG